MAGPTGTDSALRFLRDLGQGDVGFAGRGQEKLPASDFWHSGAGSRGSQCVPASAGLTPTRAAAHLGWAPLLGARLCPGGSEHSGTDDGQKTLADGHEQSGRTLPEVGKRRRHPAADADRGQAGRIRSNWGYPQQQALAKLQPALTSAGTSTARTGRSDGPRVIGNTGTCNNGASSVFLALVVPPAPIPDVALTDDKAGQVKEAPNRSLKLCVYVGATPLTLWQCRRLPS